MREAPDSRDCPKPQQNIVFNPLPVLSWEKGKAADSAQKLADYVSCEAQLTIAWYLKRKRWKKNWAQSLRVIAIVSTALAGLIPLASGVWSWLPAVGGSAAVLVAATAVGLDRFFGFSSGWMRFLTTEMQMRQILHRFLFDWAAKQARLAGAEPDERTTQILVQCCRDFMGEINQILVGEMDDWVNEFRQNLAEIDKATKARALELGQGALTVVVTNGAQCEDGWDISVDERAPVNRRGRTAGFSDLPAGSHVVRVTGIIAGKPMLAEAAFIAAEGRTEEMSLTLA